MTSNAALIVAHPGHELRLHRWLEIAHPTLFVLTDGSGSTGRPRTDSTRRLLARTGARASAMVGAMSDRDVYRAIMSGDITELARVTIAIGDALAASGFDTVVADRWEGYNPTHDLCRVVADLAIEHAMAIGGRPIKTYDYAVTTPATRSNVDGEIAIPLDEDAFARLMAAADAYEELHAETQHLLTTFGAEALHLEVLTPCDPLFASPRLTLPRFDGKPLYERYGEERVAANTYDVVLRYEQHVAPVLRELIAAVRAKTAHTEAAAAR